MTWRDNRFTPNADDNAAVAAVKANYNWLADNQSSDLAAAYLAQTTATAKGYHVDSGALCIELVGKKLGHFLQFVYRGLALGKNPAKDALGVDGHFTPPAFSVMADGQTMRIGRAPLRPRMIDERINITLPNIDLTRVRTGRG